MLGLFYEQLDELKLIHGLRTLGKCSSRSGWPRRGVYYFFETGEFRHNSTELRVVRVGTHAVSSGSKATLWSRLRTHRGTANGGNHRGSIFRKRIGESLLVKNSDGIPLGSWGVGSNAPKQVRKNEETHERLVSGYIGAMPFLSLAVDDEPSASSERSYIERNSIALLSNFMKPPIDPPSPFWLGGSCPTATIRESGLWNTNHVDEVIDPGFISRFTQLIAEMKQQ
jgi:hypothetical protein